MENLKKSSTLKLINTVIISAMILDAAISVVLVFFNNYSNTPMFAFPELFHASYYLIALFAINTGVFLRKKRALAQKPTARETVRLLNCLILLIMAVFLMGIFYFSKYYTPPGWSSIGYPRIIPWNALIWGEAGFTILLIAVNAAGAVWAKRRADGMLKNKNAEIKEINAVKLFNTVMVIMMFVSIVVNVMAHCTRFSGFILAVPIIMPELIKELLFHAFFYLIVICTVNAVVFVRGKRTAGQKTEA